MIEANIAAALSLISLILVIVVIRRGSLRLGLNSPTMILLSLAMDTLYSWIISPSLILANSPFYRIALIAAILNNPIRSLSLALPILVIIIFVYELLTKKVHKPVSYIFVGYIIYSIVDYILATINYYT